MHGLPDPRFVTVLLLMATGFLAGSTTEAADEREFLLGGDISMLPRLEQAGVVYKVNGKARNGLSLMMDHGCDSFRVRLFVNPNYRNGQVTDLPYVIDLARRIKAAGALLILDPHYSDTWASPGHQIKPGSWADLNFRGLENRIETYTADVIASQGVLEGGLHFLQKPFTEADLAARVKEAMTGEITEV